MAILYILLYIHYTYTMLTHKLCSIEHTDCGVNVRTCHEHCKVLEEVAEQVRLVGASSAVCVCVCVYVCVCV